MLRYMGGYIAIELAFVYVATIHDDRKTAVRHRIWDKELSTPFHRLIFVAGLFYAFLFFTPVASRNIHSKEIRGLLQ